MSERKLTECNRCKKNNKDKTVDFSTQVLLQWSWDEEKFVLCRNCFDEIKAQINGKIYCPSCKSREIEIGIWHQDGCGKYNRDIVEITCNNCNETSSFYPL